MQQLQSFSACQCLSAGGYQKSEIKFEPQKHSISVHVTQPPTASHTQTRSKGEQESEVYAPQQTEAGQGAVVLEI